MAEPTVFEFRALDSERAQLHALNALIAGAPDSVRMTAGTEDVEVPRSMLELLLAASVSLEDGDTVAVVREQAEVTPAAAARLLGVSRQYVDRLVAADLLRHRRLPNSSYRMIPVRDVLAYGSARDRKRAGIRTIIDAATEAGLEY